MDSPERIDRAAVRCGDKVYSVPRPGRHHDILRVIFEANDPLLPLITLRDQGFVTDQGRFVSREEACVIARAAGQILVKTNPEYQLFSEDVW
jgi:hypothetical protein